ncbi:hypothetical protein [Tenacibaculum agarivorans]|nr:hypothetical protein [Tenacibaculum agarivorans]
MKIFKYLNEILTQLFNQLSPGMNVQKIPVYVKKDKHSFRK